MKTRTDWSQFVQLYSPDHLHPDFNSGIFLQIRFTAAMAGWAVHVVRFSLNKQNLSTDVAIESEFSLSETKKNPLGAQNYNWNPCVCFTDIDILQEQLRLKAGRNVTFGFSVTQRYSGKVRPSVGRIS